MDLSQIWKIILESNTFNFIILVILFAIIIKVCKLSSLLESGINKVKETIDKSVISKEKSIAELKEAEEKVSNIHNEIEEIEKRNAEAISKSEEKISIETENQIDSINESITKLIDSKEKEIISRLSKKTILTSIEIAKENVKKILKKNPAFHEQFINESVKELDKVKL